MADVAGKLVSIAADNKVADASQIFDEEYKTGGEFQSAINKELKGDVGNLKGSVEDIKGALGLGAKPEQGGNSSSIQQRVKSLETKVDSIDSALDTHGSKIENIDSRVSVIENTKPVDSLTSDQKKMLENLDKTFNIVKNADGTYTVSMKSGADFSFESATLNDFMNLVEIIKAADGSEQTQIRLSGDAAGLWLSKDKYGTTSTKLWSNGDVEIIVGESNNDLVLKKGEDDAGVRIMNTLANIATTIQGISGLLTFKGNAGATLLASIHNETISDVKVGDCYRWDSDTAGDINPHNATGSYNTIAKDDLMLCVEVSNSDKGGSGKHTKWLVLQANLDEAQLKSQLDAEIASRLDGIQNAYEYWESQDGNGGKTKDEYIAWMKEPATTAATQANNALDQLNNKNWADVTKAEYDAMDANTNKNENGVWTPINPNLPWLNKDIKYIVEAEGESSGNVTSIINSMLVPITREDYDNLEVKNPSAFYFIITV